MRNAELEALTSKAEELECTLKQLFLSGDGTILDEELVAVPPAQIVSMIFDAGKLACEIASELRETPRRKSTTRSAT